MSIRSMTGYGAGSAQAPGLKVSVEARSVNGRHADFRLRLPAELSSEEGSLRRLLQARIRRGRVDLGLFVERTGEAGAPLAINLPVVRAVATAARALRDELGVEGDLDLKTLLSLPGVLANAPAAELSDEDRKVVGRAVETALERLDAERRREGETLGEEILARTERMEAIVSGLRPAAAAMPLVLKQRIEERLRAITDALPLDPARLAQEVAHQADRCDITEEMVRLEGHLAQVRALVAQPDGEPVGKRLDFLLQEVHRETNTITSKAVDLNVSRLALDLKTEAEKIREQAQNIE